jgi:hypothetical protein
MLAARRALTPTFGREAIMSQHGSWRPDTGGSSVALAVLLVVAALLVLAGA